jgi:hypothetical protein
MPAASKRAAGVPEKFMAVDRGSGYNRGQSTSALISNRQRIALAAVVSLLTAIGKTRVRLRSIGEAIQ